MTAQWLREASTSLPTLWEHDAPWLAINDPDQKQHIFYVRGPVGIGENGRVTAFKMMASTLGGDTERSPLTRLFYGEPVTHPGKAAAVGLTGAEMTGFSRYYATRDQSEAQTAVNVLDAGGTKDLCSVWLVGWGPQSVCMASADGQPSDKSALCVMDWRYVVRIANVDAVRRPERVLEMTTRAMYRLPTLGGNVRPVFYMNRDAQNALKDSGLRIPDDARMPVMLRGIPIREVPELRSDEAWV